MSRVWALSAKSRNRNPGRPEIEVPFDTLYENDYNQIGSSVGNRIHNLAIIPRVLQRFEQQN